MKRTTLIFIIMSMIFIFSASNAFADENNGKYRTSYQRGLEVYEYVMQYVPVNLGYPELSDAAIDELIESEDYRLVQEKISTVADCINYFTRAGFSEDAGSNISFRWCTHTSGAQTLMRGGGECGAMANCLVYLLRGDYDNIYYVQLTGHAMVIIEQDGMFYMVNPVELQNPNKEKKRGWCDVAADTTICFADSIQKLADSFWQSGITTRFFILDTGGDMLPAGLEVINGEEVPCFPKGTKKYVTVYYGDEYHYVKPDFIARGTDGKDRIIDCPDWTTGEYFVPDAMLRTADENDGRDVVIDFSIVDSKGRDKDPDKTISLSSGKKLTYSVQFFGENIKDYTVEVSDKNKASVKKLKSGKFTVTRKGKGTFYVKVKYAGVTVKYKFGTTSANAPSLSKDSSAAKNSVNINRDFRLVTSEGYERLITDTINLRKGKKVTYTVQLVTKNLKNYNVEISDSSKATVEKLDNGKIAIKAKAKGTFYLRVKCKEEGIDEKFKFKVE